MENTIDITIESLGVGLKYDSIRNQVKYIGEIEAKGYTYQLYKPKLKWDDKLFIHGFELVKDTKPMLYFNNGYLSRAEYHLYFDDYNPFLRKLKDTLNSPDIIEDPFNNLKSAFCQYNDIAIELTQVDSLYMVLRVSDYWQFYN